MSDDIYRVLEYVYVLLKTIVEPNETKHNR